MADINYNNLCARIAFEVGRNATIESADRYLKAIYKIILEELELNHRIYFKGFGYFEVKQRKSGEREINDPINGGKRLVYVKPKYSISFKPSVNFDMFVNENNFKKASDSKVKNLQKKSKKKDKMTTVDLINNANSRRKEDE